MAINIHLNGTTYSTDGEETADTVATKLQNNGNLVLPSASGGYIILNPTTLALMTIGTIRDE